MSDNANAAPDFTSESTFEVDENETMAGAPIATDADVRDYVTGYAITGGDDHAYFSITREGTLTFDGNEGADHDRPMDTVEDNSYSVSVEATSGAGDRPVAPTISRRRKPFFCLHSCRWTMRRADRNVYTTFTPASSTSRHAIVRGGDDGLANKAANRDNA